MSQLESVEQVNVEQNTGTLDHVSQQAWSSIQNEAERNMNGDKTTVSESRANNDSASDHLPMLSLSGEEALMYEKQDSSTGEGELKELPKKHGTENKPKLPQKPIDKEPFKPGKPKPGTPKPFFEPEQAGKPKF